MLITVISKAQEQLIGKKRAYVRDIMIIAQESLIDSGFTTTTHDPYDEYLVAKDTMNAVFYFKNDTCNGYKEIIKKFLLVYTIRNLNKRFIKVDGLHWVDKDGKYNITLFIPPDEKEFVIDYTKI
jgi:hypothetical protein